MTSVIVTIDRHGVLLFRLLARSPLRLAPLYGYGLWRTGTRQKERIIALPRLSRPSRPDAVREPSSLARGAGCHHEGEGNRDDRRWRRTGKRDDGAQHKAYQEPRRELQHGRAC